MPHSQPFVLVYCPENQAIADTIANGCKEHGVSLELKPVAQKNQIPLSAMEPISAGKIILLITDNFLKNAACMNGILEAARNWGGQGKLLPVVAPGTETTADGKQEPVPTAFDRVSHIIQYMNYWQDKYLQLRKEKRHQEENPDLEEQLEATKKISADVGELLRYLRTLRCYTLEELQRRNFTFAATQISGTPETSNETTRPAPSASESSLIKMIEDSSHELMAENSELSEEEEEVPGMDISGIPGMELLDQQADASLPPADEFHYQDESVAEPALNGQTEEMAGLKNTRGSNAQKKEKLKKEATPPPPFDDEDDDEMNAILNEVLMEEEADDEDDDYEFRFLSDDPENPEEFDIDSLFEDDEPAYGQGGPTDEEESEPIGENEVLLEMLDEEEEPMLEVNGAHATAREILEQAILMVEEGRKDEAFSYLNSAVEANPEDTTLRYYLAYTLARLGQQVESAKAHLQTILQQDEGHVDALFLLGELSENAAEVDNAKTYFERVADLDAEYPDIYFRLGLLTVQHFPKQEKQAASYFEKAVEQDPENAEAQYLLANLLNERLGESERAAQHFKNTLALNPAHPFANYDLARLYHRQQNFSTAKEYYKLAIANNPELRSPQNDEAFGLPVPADTEMEGSVDNGTIHAKTATTENFYPAGQAPHSSQPFTGAEHSLKATETPALIDYSQDKKLVVLITGATAGIGKATAEIFAKNGHHVIVTGRREDRLEQLKTDFEDKYGNELTTLSFDVREPDAAHHVADLLPESLKNIDLLINNAGLSRGLSPIHEGNPDHWEEMIDTNIKGLLYMTRAITPGMVERRRGHIINVSSNAGKEMYPNGNVYCATKAAVDALTRSMRLDLYQHNVRVSQVSPGHVEETEFAKIRFDGDEDRAAKTYENFQPLKAKDVAEAIYFIATRPEYVNIQDVTMFGTQQAGSNFIDRSGR